MKDIIVESSLRNAREEANKKYSSKAMLNWYDGRISAITLLHPADIVAQGARNEVRFLIGYARRHGARA